MASGAPGLGANRGEGLAFPSGLGRLDGLSPDLKSFATRAGACRYVYHLDCEALEARLRRMRAASVRVESTGERLLTFIIKVRVRPDFSIVVGPSDITRARRRACSPKMI